MAEEEDIQRIFESLVRMGDRVIALENRVTSLEAKDYEGEASKPRRKKS